MADQKPSGGGNNAQQNAANAAKKPKKAASGQREMLMPIKGKKPAKETAAKKVRYQITPDPMRHLVTGMLPKRRVDRIIAKRLGLMPPA